MERVTSLDQRPSVLVVGAGVSGLTTALCLRERGYRVTVVAEKFAPHITSVVAGALWEWPPAVCGYHHDQVSLHRSKDWCMTSYAKLIELADDPATGAFLRPVIFYFRRPVAESPRDLAKMLETRDRVLGFAHDAGLLEKHGVNPRLGLRDAYTYLAPMIDTDRYMDWLLAAVRAAGCQVLSQRLTGCLMEQVARLRRAFRVEAIVNCAGLGARELAAEDMYPLRGALVRLINDGRAMPRVEVAHCVSHDESQASQDIVFIVPRGRDRLVLGGLAEPDEWSVDIGLDDHPPVREMYERCLEFLPALRKAPIDAVDPVRVGLRPFRRQNVRLEREPGMPIVHNYGHGGAGVTFSWGCSLEAARLVEEALGCEPADLAGAGASLAASSRLDERSPAES